MATLSDNDVANAPISSLPAEILGEIFLVCTDTHPIPDPNKAPMIFTCISRWFREVALTTPILWCKINIPASEQSESWIFKYNGTFQLENPRYKHPRYLALITDWLLVRSGTSPLDIKFKNRIGCGLPGNVALLNVIFSCAERWENINIIGTHYSLLPEIAKLHETHTPSLRSLSISLVDTINPEFLSRARIMLSPKLQQLKILSHKEFSLHPDMSWTNLTDIYLTNFRGPAITLLGQINHLRSLHINPEAFRCDYKAQSTMIDMPELVTLNIDGTWGRGHWNSGLRSFFAHLSSPRLEDLDIFTQRGPSTPAELVEFTSRTNRLRNLSVTYIDYQTLASILRFTPELKKLTINPFPPFTRAESNDFLNAFVADDVNERVCSNLEDFECDDSLDPDEEAVRQLYERKLGNIPGISAWQCCYLRFEEARCRELLRELGASSEIWRALQLYR